MCSTLLSKKFSACSHIVSTEVETCKVLMPGRNKVQLTLYVQCYFQHDPSRGGPPLTSDWLPYPAQHWSAAAPPDPD